MSNPNGSSSVQDLRICMFFTEVNEKGELEVKEKTVKTFNPNAEEYMQIPAETYVIGENGTRTSSNGDVYEKNRNKIVRTINKINDSRENIQVTKNKDEKKRA